VKLDNYIKETLILNDSVVVKGFGVFVKMLESAVINEKSGEIQPPHMTIKFDNSVKVDRGTLTKYIAQKEEINEKKAENIISNTVKTWNDDLKSGKSVKLDGIGIINQDKEGKSSFETKILPGTFPDMYGLPVINIKPKTPDKGVTTTTTSKQDKKISEKPKPIKKVRTTVEKPKPTTEDSKKKTKKLILTALIIIPIIAIIIFGALNVDLVKEKFNATSEYMSNLISGDDAGSNAIDPDLNADIDRTDSIENQTETVLENYTIIDAETNESIPPVAEELQEFHKIEIIAGSFRRRSYAKRLRNQLNDKGFTAKLLPKTKGLYRVSVGSFDDVDIVATEIERIHELDPSLGVWILLNK